MFVILCKNYKYIMYWSKKKGEKSILISMGFICHLSLIKEMHTSPYFYFCRLSNNSLNMVKFLKFLFFYVKLFDSGKQFCACILNMWILCLPQDKNYTQSELVKWEKS